MNVKRDRSDSMAEEPTWHTVEPSSLSDLLEMPSQFQPGSQERTGALEAMFNTVKKKLRDGPGPNSYKRDDGDILDEYYASNGDGELGGSLGGLGGLGSSLGGGLGGGLGVLSENFDNELFHRKDDSMGGSSIFGMDDVGLSNSFKDTMTIHEHSTSHEPGILPPFAAQASMAAGSSASKAKGKGIAPVASAAAALSGAKDNEMGPPRAVQPSCISKPPASAAAMMGGGSAAAALTSIATPLSAVSVLEDCNERLSHKEVEQRRREKAKQYFDELRSLLPCGADSKFDKNTILQNTIAMIKQLQAELQHHKEIREGANGKAAAGRSASQPSSQDYHHSFEMVRQPLCFCGLDGLVWEGNQAFCQLLGYSNKSEVAGLSLLNKTASTDNEASSQHWQRLISSGMCNTAFYCQIIRKDNQTLTVNMDLNLVHKRNNPYCFLVATNPTS